MGCLIWKIIFYDLLKDVFNIDKYVFMLEYFFLYYGSFVLYGWYKKVVKFVEVLKSYYRV